VGRPRQCVLSSSLHPPNGGQHGELTDACGAGLKALAASLATQARGLSGVLQRGSVKTVAAEDEVRPVIIRHLDTRGWSGGHSVIPSARRLLTRESDAAGRAQRGDGHRVQLARCRGLAAQPGGCVACGRPPTARREQRTGHTASLGDRRRGRTGAPRWVVAAWAWAHAGGDCCRAER